MPFTERHDAIEAFLFHRTYERTAPHRRCNSAHWATSERNARRPAPNHCSTPRLHFGSPSQSSTRPSQRRCVSPVAWRRPLDDESFVRIRRAADHLNSRDRMASRKAT
jgi:hypothetical protein